MEHSIGVLIVYADSNLVFALVNHNPSEGCIDVTQTIGRVSFSSE